MARFWPVKPGDVGSTPTLSANFGTEVQSREQRVVNAKGAGLTPVRPATLLET